MYRLVLETLQNPDDFIVLTDQQKHYLKRVLRLKDGDNFVGMDGQGKVYLAQFINESAQIIKPLKESTELPIPVTLIVALPKGNGFEDIVRCCTELGVNTLIPVISQRTILKPSLQKVERWRKIAIEAAEQSERQIVPIILEPVSLAQSLKNVADNDINCYICITRQKTNHLLTYLSTPQTVPLIIATGCEGGWTDEEVSDAIAVGFQPVTLGPRILRAVTAPIVALSLISSAIEYNCAT
ncbi:16S rRNA (uracil(1498)-N(3))-methyltransferase [Aphanothece sacrum]|uniref:Ribosomal RNA small subunit methyltransferase E n=1 Tax=Aphanothece sacrum FPU1 TaxID=1920663 RepID=A0A401IKR6_APHSA|nr:16S rRNA (uracil(1498)-N(3))-methyltransferase [Aphanothece sacrum]GBF81835.1 16S rRNA methyltransferase [Aphanothece sacrum FPU1]GBF85654.1 16S rRNA methyltransferase [Aphanothece sacrum FPU3]